MSNAGAYRSEIADFVTGVEAVVNGHRAWFGPELLEFSYRDSIIRRNPDAPITLLRVRLKLVPGDMDEGYALARETQRKRILKQPPQASAGSFFKNVVDKKFAETLPDLDPVLREKGVVPAGFLIERAGLCGASVGGAMISPKHANFIVNLGGHEAGPIRALARRVRYHVRETFGVELEEEVLYLGTWPEE